MPDEVPATDEVGIFTNSPVEVIKAEGAKWQQVWEASTRPLPNCDIDAAFNGYEGKHLEVIAADQVLCGSLDFSANTCQTFDGIHVRHYSLLPEIVREAVGLLLTIMECYGRIPSAVSWLPLALIPKSSGGNRTIGLFFSLYRLWGKIRCCFCRQWETCARRDQHQFDIYRRGLQYKTSQRQGSQPL